MPVCPLGNISIRTKQRAEITVTGEDAQHSDLPTNVKLWIWVKNSMRQVCKNKRQTRASVSENNIAYQVLVVYHQIQSDRVYNGSIFFSDKIDSSSCCNSLFYNFLLL